jgi:hypothetical protein
MRFTKLNYCQYLLSSQINYTLTHLADHLGSLSCPLKKNRLVDDTGGREKYKQIESLNWSKAELEQGKIIKIKAFPQARAMAQ